MTERELFLSALDIEDETVRHSHLRTACAGDAALLARVEALLASLKSDPEFLQNPVLEQLGQAGNPEQAVTIFMEAGSTLNEAPASDETLASDAEIPVSSEAECSRSEAPFHYLLPSETASSLGRLGHYEVLEVLGRGAFGTVFRAIDQKLRRTVAIKVLAPELAASARARERFLGEARAAAAIRHDNVVSVYAVEDSPLPYLVMEYVPGQTLQKRLDERGPFALRDLLHLGTQIAEGLAAAHARGLVHRDIKPGNILLEAGPRERAKITDFGLARAADDASRSQFGTIAGTPMYMAPEQALGTPVDQRADLFSFGSVLYVMATGQPPFPGPSSLAVLKRVTEVMPRPIAEVSPKSPAWLSAIISRLHAKAPEDRYQTAEEVAALLARCRDEIRQHGAVHHVSGIMPGATAAPPRPPRRWTFAALLLLALTGLGIAEAGGYINLQSTVIRLFSRDGTLVVEVDDPDVSVTIDETTLVIKGSGIRELRLDPGRHLLQATRDGKVLREEVVSIEKNGRKIVKVSTEPSAQSEQGTEDSAAWEKATAGLSASEQVKAVVERLKKLNPRFDGFLKPVIDGGVVRGLDLSTHDVSDISPLRALNGLTQLNLHGDLNGDLAQQGGLVDLSPLRGLHLKTLRCVCSPVFDLSPLAGMPLEWINVERTRVTDLSPLKGMPLHTVNFYMCPVESLAPLQGAPLKYLMAIGSEISDLSPLKGMPLEEVYLTQTHVADLAPLHGAPLKVLWCSYTKVTSLAALQGMPLVYLGCDNNDLTDLSPLAGLSLNALTCQNAKIADHSPLQKLPLRKLTLDFDARRDAALLRSMATLEEINQKPAAEFWKGVSPEN